MWCSLSIACRCWYKFSVWWCLLDGMVVNVHRKQHYTPCLKKSQTPVIFWHNFIKTAVMSIILGIENLYLVLTDSLEFDALPAYDVADLLKLYFRELPDCLLTSKLSHAFISIFQRQYTICLLLSVISVELYVHTSIITQSTDWYLGWKRLNCYRNYIVLHCTFGFG